MLVPFGIVLLASASLPPPDFVVAPGIDTLAAVLPKLRQLARPLAKDGKPTKACPLAAPGPISPGAPLLPIH